MNSGVLLLISFMFTILMMVMGLSSEVTGETLCVDGKDRINLEGIMCEDKTTTWFGLNEAWMLLTLIPISGVILFIK